MSVWSVTRLQINDKTVIMDCLNELGYKYTVHNKPVVFYSGDRSGKAHIILERKNNKKLGEDIGIFISSNESEIMSSSSSQSIQEEILQIYGYKKCINESVTLGGYLQSKTEDKEGRTVLSLTFPG